MTVKELINELSKCPNQDAEVILEDGILSLAVKLTHVNFDSFWQDGAIDLIGSKLPEGRSDWEAEEED